MWDKRLAALMEAHHPAPYRALAADWCGGHHRLETAPNEGLSALLSDSKMNLIGWQRRPGTGLIFTSLTICAPIGRFSTRDKTTT